MKKLILFSGLVFFGCNTSRKPDLVIDGREYALNKKCIKSHQETKFCYHYGWNSWRGKFEFHWGNQTKTICDSTRIDTIEINIEEKYYKK
jgi:hypothetical protein